MIILHVKQSEIHKQKKFFVYWRLLQRKYSKVEQGDDVIFSKFLLNLIFIDCDFMSLETSSLFVRYYMRVGKDKIPRWCIIIILKLSIFIIMTDLLINIKDDFMQIFGICKKWPSVRRPVIGYFFAGFQAFVQCKWVWM